ncbi:uncharacterized protein TrAtP1_007005 [Trichoderma atroviride]|uniref:uncharacterized protein n=1 Tax=Hypocrea atroviridis TaxID=63577 RepID=UPI00332A4A04|nr:hypothetical protein TrAtP1_007005 [Trichoderma atroviride]
MGTCRYIHNVDSRPFLTSDSLLRRGYATQHRNVSSPKLTRLQVYRHKINNGPLSVSLIPCLCVFMLSAVCIRFSSFSF